MIPAAMHVKIFLCLIAMTAYSIYAANAQEPPKSARSQAAIERVKPHLEKAFREKGLRFGAPIFIRIIKESKELELWVENEGRYELFKVYDICTFSGHLGPKLQTGDLQSPEGFYFVSPGRMNPASRFHLSINIGYPNAYDRHHGRTGSALMVHGNCVSIGCYAMTDPGIEEIYALADAALCGGQSYFRVHIFPFRMTDHKMQQQRKNKWYAFWEELKGGYDIFETSGKPPNFLVQDGKMVFEEM